GGKKKKECDKDDFPHRLPHFLNLRLNEIFPCPYFYLLIISDVNYNLQGLGIHFYARKVTFTKNFVCDEKF
ncbi:MAG: hypothetical protein IJM68_03270, partial [Synergistaceae bacterium]|nr:hypothetical protein [Synergistaceae bacterium]